MESQYKYRTALRSNIFEGPHISNKVHPMPLYDIVQIHFSVFPIVIPMFYHGWHQHLAHVDQLILIVIPSL